jgi:hypothetical protein
MAKTDESSDHINDEEEILFIRMKLRALVPERLVANREQLNELVRAVDDSVQRSGEYFIPKLSASMTREADLSIDVKETYDGCTLKTFASGNVYIQLIYVMGIPDIHALPKCPVRDRCAGSDEDYDCEFYPTDDGFCSLHAKQSLKSQERILHEAKQAHKAERRYYKDTVIPRYRRWIAKMTDLEHGDAFAFEFFKDVVVEASTYMDDPKELQFHVRAVRVIRADDLDVETQNRWVGAMWP